MESAHGRTRMTADMVVGADGVNSTVAQWVGARRYMHEEGTRSAYRSYLQVRSWDEDWEAAIQHRGASMRLAARMDCAATGQLDACAPHMQRG